MKERVGLLLAILVIGGCSKSSSENCSEASDPSDPACAGDAMSSVCTTNDQCSGATSVCDISAGTCVQCIAPDQASACSGTSPACGGDHACRACSVHADCASDVCLPDGSCAVEGDVAYVDAAGSGTVCRRALPCATLIDAVATNLLIVKIAAGTVKASSVTVIDGRSVTIVAEPGAKLDRDGDGPILQVQSANANVSIVGLEISGQSGASTFAIGVMSDAARLSLTRCEIKGNQGTAVAALGGSLTITSSSISENEGLGVTASGENLTLSRSTISFNRGGGVVVAGNGTFDITNNFVFRNGDTNNGTCGGMSLGLFVAGANRLEFNTIADNETAINTGGVKCYVPAFAAPNNIIIRNSLGGSPFVADSQTKGTCTYASSMVFGSGTEVFFVDPDAISPFDYHLSVDSRAIDKATPSAVTVDFDGDPRPTGGASDVGADERVP